MEIKVKILSITEMNRCYEQMIPMRKMMINNPISLLNLTFLFSTTDSIFHS